MYCLYHICIHISSITIISKYDEKDYCGLKAVEAFSWYFQFINMLMSWSCSDIACRHTVMHGAVLPLSLKLHHYCRQGHGMHYAFLFNNRCGSMNIISHTFVLWYCITRTPAWSLQWQSFIAQLESSFLKICNSRLLTSTALQGGFFFFTGFSSF